MKKKCMVIIIGFLVFLITLALIDRLTVYPGYAYIESVTEKDDEIIIQVAMGVGEFFMIIMS